MIAVRRKVWMKHVGKGRAGSPFELADRAIASFCTETLTDAKELDVHKTAISKFRGASRAECVEAPRLEARERLRLPLAAIRKALLHLFVVRTDPERLAEMPIPVGMVNAAQKNLASVRSDDPPSSAVTLADTVETVIRSLVLRLNRRN